jgi:hypothetical protein
MSAERPRCHRWGGAVVALKKSDVYGSLWNTCDELGKGKEMQRVDLGRLIAPHDPKQDR